MNRMRNTAVAAFAAATFAAACSGDAPLAGGPRESDGGPNLLAAVLSPATTRPGDRIRTTDRANIRSAPRITGTLLGSQPLGAVGRVLEGPVTDLAGDRLVRWRIDFDTGPDGWAASDYLDQTSSSIFTFGTRVQSAGGTNVRSGPSGIATQVGAQPDGMPGVVIGGPVYDAAGDRLVRWQVDFDDGADGWAAETWLARSSAPPVAASLVLSPDTGTVVAGTTVQLTAVAKDAAGTTIPNAPMSWRSLDTTLARVAATGLVTAVAAGVVQVSVASGTRADTARIVVQAPPVTGVFVAPDGSATGSGTRTSPLDLRSALAGAGGRVAPGDTVWLRGGRYSGSFRATVEGQSGRPIVFRQYPGERATIDGAGTPGHSESVWYVNAQYVEFWDFEITNSDGNRTTTVLGNGVRPNLIANYSSNTRYVNLVVHDGGVAFYNETGASNVEIAGCVFYNNGWQAPDRGHGHALYLKSNSGPVLARDNVMFNQFGYGVHVYSNAGSGLLNNIRIEGNVAFNNGTQSNNSTSNNILVGGEATSTGSSVRDNMTYFPPGVGGTNVRIGYSTTRNGTVDVRDNTFVGGGPVVDVGYWSSASFSGNTLVGADRVVSLNDPATGGQTWTLNTHQRDPLAVAWRFAGTTYNFATWRTRSLVGLTDLALPALPTGTRVVVRPNPHQQGRAHVVVYNWSGAGSAIADLSGVLRPGDRYEVRNVQDIFGAPVASGTYAGAITLPMDGVTPPAPNGMSAARSPRTAPYFDTFVVTRVSDR